MAVKDGVPAPEMDAGLDAVVHEVGDLLVRRGFDPVGLLLVVRGEGGLFTKIAMASDDMENVRSIMLREAQNDEHWEQAY